MPHSFIKNKIPAITETFLRKFSFISHYNAYFIYFRRKLLPKNANIVTFWNVLHNNTNSLDDNFSFIDNI